MPRLLPNPKPMTRFFLPLSFLSLLLFSCAQPPEYSDWRGPDRDGIYPETGLLTEWPEEGPHLLWSFEGLGYGHNSVAVANEKVFVTGVNDSAQSRGILFALDLNGELLWKKDYLL